MISIACLIAIDCVAQQRLKEIKPDQYRAINWSMEDGLSGNLANVMIKDVKGFLWVGNIGGELCRFDGANFKKYIPDPHKSGAINSGGIWAFVEDSLNNIWIGTQKGLSRYDMKADTFTNFLPLIDSASSRAKTDEGGETTVIPFWATKEEVFCMEPGLWITSYDVRSLVKKKLQKLSQEDILGIGFPTIYSIFDAGSNSIWMLAQHGLLRISLKDGKRNLFTWPRNESKDMHGLDSEAMQLDRKRNSIWINSCDGLLEFTLADKRFQRVDALNEFVKLKDYDRYVGIDIDKNGRVWLATKPKGILTYDPKTKQVTQLFSNPDLQQQVGDRILHIYCDRDGIAWVSDYIGKGIYELLPFNAPVKRYGANPKLQDSLSNNAVLTIIPAAQGKMWIGTNDGLNIFDPITEKFELLREKDLPGIKGNVIAPLYIDTIHQTAWLSATRDPELYFEMDVYEMDIKTRKCRPILFRDGTNLPDTLRIGPAFVRPYKKGLLACDEMHGMFEIKEGNLFADLLIPFKALLGEFDLVEDHIFLKNFKSLPNFHYQNINGKWTKTPHPLDTLEWRYILYNIKDQSQWINFKNELVHYDKDFRKIKTYSLEDGYDGGMDEMQTDNAGNLWFFNGLKQIGRLNTTTGIITTLSEADGYQKLNFDHHGPAAKDAQGNLYFGTGGNIGMGGLCRIYPERYSPAATSTVYLRSLDINQKPYLLSTGINNLEELSLNYDQKTIRIETGIIDYYAKGKGRIRYKLEGEGKVEDWQYAPAYYTIRYDGLVPGKYKLVLQASNAGNEFNSPVKTLIIKISSPFWATWWFRITASVFIIALIYGIMRWRLQQKFRLQLERSEKEKQLADMGQKTAELKQQATDLEMQALRAQMNPHFIFNSLNSINRFILQNNRAQASEYLTKFSKLVRMILQNSQASLISLESELEALQLYLEMEALRFNYHFNYKISFPKDLDTEILKVPPLIIQPYVENAIWHGLMHKEEKGQLDIEISRENDYLFFKITDDGIGRKKAAELTSKSATKHKSMGLRITAERIAMMHSSNGNESLVAINDLINADGSAAGTEIIIKMPVLYE